MRESVRTFISKYGSYVSITSKREHRYKTIGLIGKGSFGVVYSALNERNNLVAVKTKKVGMDPNFDPVSNQFFRSELDSLVGLSHANIVTLLGSEFKGHLLESIVLEYVHGENLDLLVARSKALHENMIRIYTQQIFDAILYMHSKNVIHRDIKTANIMVIGNYKIKIIDFGMAKRVNNAYSLQTDTNTSVVGTLAYMAPELTKFENYDARVDIWSLGVVVYEMANGEPFYRSNHVPYTISNLQTPVSLMNLSPNANSFIQSCLTKNYRARPTAFTLATHTFLGSNLSSQSYHNLHPAAPHKVSSQNYNQELNQVAADLINNAVNVVNNNNNNNNNSNSNSSHSHNSSNGNSLLGAAPVQVPPIVPNPYHNDYRSMGFGGMGLGYQKSFRTEFQKEFNVQQHFNPNSFNFNSFSDDFKIF